MSLLHFLLAVLLENCKPPQVAQFVIKVNFKSPVNPYMVTIALGSPSNINQ